MKKKVSLLLIWSIPGLILFIDSIYQNYFTINFKTPFYITYSVSIAVPIIIGSLLAFLSYVILTNNYNLTISFPITIWIIILVLIHFGTIFGMTFLSIVWPDKSLALYLLGYFAVFEIITYKIRRKK